MGGSLKFESERYQDKKFPFICLINLIKNKNKNLSPGLVLKTLILDWMDISIKFLNFSPSKNGKQRYFYAVDKNGNFSTFKLEKQEIELLNFFPITNVLIDNKCISFIN